MQHAAICLAALALAATPVAAQEDRWGPPVDDISRYVGLYSDDMGRDWFVAEARPPVGSDAFVPPGHLMIGATFGDVAPWYMTTVAKDVFLRPGWNEYNPDITVTFEFGVDGRATLLEYTYGNEAPQTWSRSGDLPDGW